jgi:hypothetical protein
MMFSLRWRDTTGWAGLSQKIQARCGLRPPNHSRLELHRGAVRSCVMLRGGGKDDFPKRPESSFRWPDGKRVGRVRLRNLVEWPASPISHGCPIQGSAPTRSARCHRPAMVQAVRSSIHRGSSWPLARHGACTDLQHPHLQRHNRRRDECVLPALRVLVLLAELRRFKCEYILQSADEQL